MSDGDRRSHLLPPDPAYLHQTLMKRSGWTEWTRQKIGRYRERIVYRRRNPFGGIYAPMGIMYASIYLFVESGLAGPVGEGLKASPIWDVAPHITAVAILLPVLGWLYARLRTREEDQFRESSMYPPKDYWEEA